MLSDINSHALLADYKAMAECLFAIQQQEANGAFNSNPEALVLIHNFEGDVLRKLYYRTLRILAILEGVVTATPEDLLVQGDFDENDFSGLDFHIGFLDNRNNGYSSRFQTILNVFEEFVLRWTELSDVDKQNLDAVLIPVLYAFEELKKHLTTQGINPCIIEEVPYLANSSSLFLQAAGSDGTDGTAEGIHLRWGFLGDLGNHHFPKGDLAIASNDNYNRAGDYVQLSKTPYINPAQLSLNFETDKPAIDYSTRTWTYVINSTLNTKVISTRIILRFPDMELYNNLAVIINPLTDPYGFLSSYEGAIELELYNKTAFSIGFGLKKKDSAGNSIFKLEVISSADLENVSLDTISARKAIELSTAAAITETIRAENIHRIRIKKSPESYLQSFSFETYSDFLATRAESDWTSVESGFSLNLTDQDVFDRLQNSRYTIDNSWPFYNEGAKVKVSNYHDKWNVSYPNDPSIKEVVQTYLNLSTGANTTATINIKEEDAPEEDEGIPISYLDGLNLMSLDYHIARMLGLGYIDTPANLADTDKFIYRISYTNRKARGSAEIITHKYLSLPTAKEDSRLPAKPAIRPILYQLPVDNELTSTMFDADGYAANADVRIVNIGRHPYGNEEGTDYLADLSLTGNFNQSENLPPILFGLEYRPANQPSYVRPEITSEKSIGHIYYSHDTAFPATGSAETTPVLDNVQSLYVHFLKQNGIHHYAIYGISWFSRASVLSDEVLTNETVFPIKNTLLPPIDVAVQYIQKEEPLLFTAEQEQIWLEGRTTAFSGQDVNYTRVTFNWLDIVDVTDRNPAEVVRANTIIPSFKSTLPLEVRGIIVDLIPDDEMNSQAYIQTGSYTLLDGSIQSPTIHAADYSKFTNSILSTPEGQFKVLSVSEGFDGPLIKIERSRESENVEDPDSEERYGVKEVYMSPEVGSKFSIVENLSNPQNWEPLTTTIDLVDFTSISAPQTETTFDSEGNPSSYLVGGITGPAIVEAWKKGENDVVVPGFYRISYQSGVTLPEHPQINLPYNPALPEANSPSAIRGPHVEWYNGFVRIQSSDGVEKKLVEVVRIENTNPLVLCVYDASYEELSIKLSSSGTDVDVNFHPGYKAYLFAEPAPKTFNKTNIWPGVQDNDKRTLIGLQTADTRPSGTGYKSSVSNAAILLARRIEEPVQLEAPSVFGLKVRPDATKKAALTFDTKIAPDAAGNARNPFGFMFYRTTNIDILNALYLPETVKIILSTLNGHTSDPFYNQRYLELANQVFSPANSLKFKVYEATPQAYGFPVPDKAEFKVPGDTVVQKKVKYKAAIRGTLLPLTEQTPIFAFIKKGDQTENKLPKIRSLDGELLEPTHADFDPFPMARKYTKAAEANTTYVRFTDYTLSGSSRFLYFFSSAEVTVQLAIGPLSLFTGPVSILNTLPGEPPVVRAFSIGPSAGEGQMTVSFQLSTFAAHDNIYKVRIYRSLDKSKTTSLYGMSSYLDVPLSGDASTGLEVVDTFEDLDQAPLGETVYYRLAGIRSILNEKDEPEDVLSLGSEVVTVNLIDMFNPSAPELSYDSSENKLSWLPTTNKGTYYLFKQNNRGNWERITGPFTGGTSPITYTLPTPLALQDEDGDRVYHRFKVKVENSSGLLNLVEKELTI